LSVTCDRSVVFSKSSGLLQQQNWQSRYNWNIVESGAKHHQTNKQTKQIPFLWNFSCIGVFCPWYNIMLYPMCKDCFSFQIVTKIVIPISQELLVIMATFGRCLWCFWGNSFIKGSTSRTATKKKFMQ
jgi:hypothetical protein